MPINTNLLIAAPMLQDLLVDKTGIPMAGGTVTCYHDNARTTLKNWYYQTGAPGAYTYTQLPNPLTLSAAGTICDINGVDTIPFFYPYLESVGNIATPAVDTYYIYIESHNGTTIITRQNFPFLGNSSSGNTSGDEFNNLIVNGGFWRNIAPNTLNITPYASTTLGAVTAPAIPSASTNWINNGITVAPSQHDGFSMPDIEFFRNNAASTDILTFVPFPLSDSQIIKNVIFPEYYASHASTATTGETYKYYQFPISLHVNQLDNAQFTVSVLANSPESKTIKLQLLQYLGTGAAATTPSVISNTNIVLSPSWNIYTLTDVFPSTLGLNLSNTADDAYYLQVALPINSTYTVNFTKPELYLTNDSIPANGFETYDEVNSIISTPRTGDTRTSINSFSPYGWVPLNDGTIGLNSSGATTRANADTWPLYSLLWNSVSNTYAPVSTGRGVSAYADFTANKTITLTQTLSRVIGSVGPGAGLTNWALGQTIGSESDSTTLSIANMPAHDHPGSTVALGIGNQGANPTGFVTSASLGPTSVSVASQGSGTPFTTSNLQPSVFYNMFIKL